MISDSSIVRCFLAVYPDAAALQRISEYIDCCRGRNSTIKWEQALQVHITIKYIGDIARGNVRTIETRLREQLAQRPVIHAIVEQHGAFPNYRRPSVIWLGCTDHEAELQAMQKTTEDVCWSVGTPKERKAFTPHFTIGRVKNYSRIGDLQKDLEACSLKSFPVEFDAIRIMESTLTPMGAIHTEIVRIPLLRS
jgi:RNA 2',3'-cyclic 3'-phosphodiesterase